MAVLTPTPVRTLRRSPAPSWLVAIAAATAVPVILAGTVALLSTQIAADPPTPGGPVAPSDAASPPTSPTPTATATPTPSTRTPRPTPEPTPVVTASPSASPTIAPPSRTAAPTPTPTSPPDYSRPGGTYLDILTAFHAYTDWQRSVLDTVFMLPSNYYPGDLVDSSTAGLNSGYPVRSFVIADLKALVDAARANGTPIAVVSAFRSYAQQQSTFEYWVGVGGYQQALRTSARAGHSEHQLGTTLDFTSAGGAAPWEYDDWAATPAGAWMAANAWRYGFVMSYPAGSFNETGYDYEPWHYRYVGRDVAAAVHGSGVPLRRYLWERQ